MEDGTIRYVAYTDQSRETVYDIIEFVPTRTKDGTFDVCTQNLMDMVISWAQSGKLVDMYKPELY